VALTSLYVDGFNLYKGIESHVSALAWRGDPVPPHWKWLDLWALGERIVPKDTINRVRYFTARVTAPAGDPDSPQRQATYLRALHTLPDCKTHFGLFKSGRVRMPLFRSTGPVRRAVLSALGFQPKAYPDGNVSVPILKTEEKGSDVNLATYLLVDAFKGRFEKAVVLSNDTDLCEPIRIVAQDFGLPVVVVSPRGHQKVANALRRVASEARGLRIAPVGDSQFPETLTDAQGTFTRPASW